MMKHKKKYILAGMALVSICLIAASFTGNQPQPNQSKVIWLNQHIFQTNTNFHISDTGEARVYVDYAGYDAMQNVEISVRIAKKGIFIFWDDILSETYTASGEYYYHAYRYDIAEAGTYRCTVTYMVISEDGKKDVITFEDTAVYDGATHTNDVTETTSVISETTIPEEITTLPETTTAEVTTPAERPKPIVSLLKREFVYDENGRYTMSVDYDENGNKLREIDYTAEGAKTEEREYFENGRLKRVSSYQGSGHETVSYTYYESGRLCEVTKNTAGSTRYHTTIYDERGTVSRFRVDIINCEGITTQTAYYDRYGKLTGYYTFSYDEFGRPLRETRYDGNQMKISHRDHLYDDNARYIKSVLYDARGNWIAEEYPK
jgi:YD repeat-containing protein